MVACTLAQLAGGYRVGDVVFYQAHGETFASGDRVEYGLKGEVMGPVPGDADQLAVKFEGNQGNVHLEPTDLSRTKPPEQVRAAHVRTRRRSLSLPLAPPMLLARSRRSKAWAMCMRAGTGTA